MAGPLTEAQQALVMIARSYALAVAWNRLRGVYRATLMDHDEVRQEALLAVCLASRNWPPDRPAALWKSYAAAAVNSHLSHLCRSALTSKRNGRPLRLDWLDPDDYDEPAARESQQRDDRLDGALGLLEEPRRVTFALKLAGLTNREIATKLGRSASGIARDLQGSYKLIREAHSGD